MCRGCLTVLSLYSGILLSPQMLLVVPIGFGPEWVWFHWWMVLAEVLQPVASSRHWWNKFSVFLFFRFSWHQLAATSTYLPSPLTELLKEAENVLCRETFCSSLKRKVWVGRSWFLFMCPPVRSSEHFTFICRSNQQLKLNLNPFKFSWTGRSSLCWYLWMTIHHPIKGTLVLVLWKTSFFKFCMLGNGRYYNYWQSREWPVPSMWCCALRLFHWKLSGEYPFYIWKAMMLLS